MKTAFKICCTLILTLIIQSCSDRMDEVQIAPETTASQEALKSATSAKIASSALTMDVIVQGKRNNEFRFFIMGNMSGEISVSWGDGTSTSYNFDSENYTHIHHLYNKPGKHSIEITGNIQAIKGISFLNYEALSPVVVDVSNATNLIELSIPGRERLRSLVLPETAITDLSIPGPNKLTSKEIDSIIGIIYDAAVANNVTHGFINLSANYLGDGTNWTSSSSEGMVGPPSSEGLEKLKVLRDSYHWNIQKNM